MRYLILSFSHKNTDISAREKLAFNSDDKKREFSKKLLEHKSINEVLILSTCNRVEILASVKECIDSLEYIFCELSEFSGILKEELEGRADIYEDNGAIHHIFSVASSLDSVVVGETQIVGQIKEAFKFCFDNGFCSQKIARVMHHTFRCAAAVRSSTEISSTPVSISSVAVNKAKELNGGSLAGFSAVVIGVGEMGRICAEHLVKNSCNVILINRDIERAKNLAKELGDTTVVDSFEKLESYINRYRYVFSATSAPETIIKKEMIKEADFERHWFDIAVPRDIDDNCKESGVNIYTVDDLKSVVAQNRAFREKQAGIAYSIIGKFTVEFYKWLQTLEVGPIIKRMRDVAKRCAQKELERAIKKNYLPKEHKDEVEKILHQAFNCFLHRPTANLKKVADDPEFDTIVQSFQYLFGINEDEPRKINMYKCEYHLEGGVAHPKDIEKGDDK